MTGLSLLCRIVERHGRLLGRRRGGWDVKWQCMRGCYFEGGRNITIVRGRGGWNADEMSRSLSRCSFLFVNGDHLSLIYQETS